MTALRFSIMVGLLLLVPVAGAGTATFQAALHATSVAASGSVQVAGPLMAFLQEQTTNETGGASPAFTLQAAHLRVETDRSEPSFHNNVIEPKLMPTTASNSYDNALVRGVSNGALYRWNLFSSDTANPAHASVSAGCAEAGPSGMASISRSGWAAPTNVRPETTRDASHSLEWDCLDGASIQVTGDFWLSLWVWDANLTAGGTTQELHSGPQQSSTAPAGAPDISGVVSRDQEIYFYATNATLTVPSLTGTGYTLLTGQDTTLSGAGLKLQGATGRLDLQGASMDLKGSTMAVIGQTQAVLSGAGTGKPFGVQLAGSPEAVGVDGNALLLSTSLPARHGQGWLLVGVLGLVVAGPLLAVPLLRRRPASRQRRLREVKERAREFLNRGRFDAAATVLRKWEALEPGSGELHHQWATALASQGDLEGAWRRLEIAEALLNGAQLGETCLDKALLASLLSRQASGRPSEWRLLAQRSLEKAIRLCPGLLMEATRHPVLRALLDEIDSSVG